jgi:cytochrome P450
VREEITAEAEGVVRKLVAQGSFDAATELANHLPVSVVSNLVGLPEKGRERMLVWAEEMFNCFGPMNDKTIASFEVLDEMMDYATNEAVPDKLKPGSWARGHPRRGGARGGARAGVPGDDGRDLVRTDPQLMPSAINEVLRHDAPIQGFSRYVARDVDMDGVLLPAARAPSCSTGPGRKPRRAQIPRPRSVRCASPAR